MNELGDFEIRSQRGVLLIGALGDVELTQWRAALRQDRLSIDLRTLLRDIDRGARPPLRAHEWQLSAFSPLRQRDDQTTARRIGDAIEAGRLVAIYLPGDLTMLAPAPAAATLPLKVADRRAVNPAWRPQTALERVVAMLEGLPRLPIDVQRDRWNALTGRDLAGLSEALIASTRPSSGDQEISMDPLLAGWAYHVAGRAGLRSYHEAACTVRAAWRASATGFESLARAFDRAVAPLGMAFLNLVFLRQAKAGSDASDAEAIAPSPRIIRRRAVSAPEAPAEAEDDVFPSGARQAKVLKTAARDGTPFCEICSRSG